MKVFKYFKNSLPAVIAIVLLLIVQAYCDLSLPSYTSDIVDIGIAQGGIPDAVPSQIRPESLKRIELFMTDDEIRTVESAYALNADGNYELTLPKDTIWDELSRIFGISVSKDETREELSQIFAVPMSFIANAQRSGEIDLAQIEAGLAAGVIPKEQIIQKRDEAAAALGDMAEIAIPVAASAYVRDEYEAMGMDLENVQTDYMWATGGKMLGLTLLSVIAAVIVGLIASYTAAKISKELREKTYEKTLSFGNTELDRFTIASLITRNTNDIQQIQMALVILMRIVLYAPIVGIGGVIKVIGTASGMGWIIGVAVAAVLILIITLFVTTMPKFKKMQVLVDKLNLVSREILTGLPVIRAFGREKHEEARFDESNRNLMKTQLFVNRAMAFMMPVMLLIMNAVTLMIVWFGGHSIDAGTLQVGNMMAFIMYTIQIVMAFMMLSMISILLPRANVAASRIEEVLETEPAIMDAPKVLPFKVSKGILKFNDVSFRFPGAEADVLRNISFTANPGKTTAIIGSTGSGKSTLIALIPRLYDVTGGSITIDGLDIREMSQKDLRACLGFVPQKGILFSGDIASNIKFAGNDISDEDMTRAAEIAQVAEFISQKENGYYSAIAQGGSNVSGGQKQRLSIARAIAKKPKIFVFDDIFSALDYKTETNLRRALGENMKNSTVIIVAQRISTVLQADQIIVLERGEIVGIGTHKELLKSCEAYLEIAQSQLSETELNKEVSR